MKTRKGAPLAQSTLKGTGKRTVLSRPAEPSGCKHAVLQPHGSRRFVPAATGRDPGGPLPEGLGNQGALPHTLTRKAGGGPGDVQLRTAPECTEGS